MELFHKWFIRMLPLFFVMPLLFIPSQFIFPFIVPKIIYFRALTLFFLVVYGYLLFRYTHRYRPQITRITVALVIFFATVLLSTFAGVDWYKSMWDNHERMLGFFTLFHYFIFYLMLTSVVTEAEEWRYLHTSFLILGSVVMVSGILQRYIPHFLLNTDQIRVSGTLGNPIYYGGYGLFLFSLGLLMFIQLKRPLLRYSMLIPALLGWVGIFLSGTRGTLIGFLVGLAVAAACGAVLLPPSPIKRLLRYGALVGLVIGLALILFRSTPFVQELPGVGRLLAGFDGTVSTRVMAWDIAIDAWKDRPVFGWGPNTYFYAFNAYYNPEFFRFGAGETWFDNAHSMVFNTLTTGGIIGLFAYVGIYVVALWQLYLLQRQEKIAIATFLVLIGFFVAHFVHNLFVFENPTSYLYFFFLLAYINSVIHKEKITTSITPMIHKQTNWFVVVPIILFWLIFKTDIQPAQANMETLNAVKQLEGNTHAVSLYEQYIQNTSSPHWVDIQMDFSRITTPFISQYANQGKGAQAKSLWELNVEMMKKNMARHPLDIRFHLQLASLYQMGAYLLEDPTYLARAEEVVEEALRLSPNRQQVEYILGMIYAQQGRIDESIAFLRESTTRSPFVEEGWIRLAAVYLYAGRVDEAGAVLEEAKIQGFYFGSPLGKQFLAEFNKARTLVPSS